MPEPNNKPKKSSQDSFLDVIGALSNQAGPKGVIPDKEGKVSPTLTPGEAGRYKNIFKIMKDVISPDKEAANIESTKEGKVAGTKKMQAASTGKSDGGGFGVGAFVALAAAAGLLAAYLKGLKDRLADLFGDDKVTAGEGIFRGLISLRGIFGMLNVLGKIFQPLVKGFQLLKNSKAFKSLGGTATKVLKVGSKIGKAAGSLFKIIRKVGKTIGKRLKFIPFLGSIFNFMTAYEEFQKGNYIRAGLELLAGVLNLIPGLGNVAGSALNGVLLMYDLMSSNESGKDLRNLLGNPGEKLKELVAPIVDKIVGFFKGIGEWLIEGAGALVDLVKKGLKMFLPDSWFEGASSATSAVTGAIADVFVDDYKGLDPNSAEAKFNKARKAENRNREELKRALKLKDPEGYAAAYKKIGVKGASGKNMFMEYLNANGIEDGVVYQNGKATRIDDKDSLLAAKPGGPIDKMLDQNRGIQTQQLNVLIEIRDGIRALKSSDGSMSFSNNSLTQEFFA